jgi:hypothetical protein
METNLYTAQDLVELDQMILDMSDDAIKENFLSLQTMDFPDWYMEAWHPRLEAELNRRGL